MVELNAIHRKLKYKEAIILNLKSELDNVRVQLQREYLMEKKWSNELEALNTRLHANCTMGFYEGASKVLADFEELIKLDIPTNVGVKHNLDSPKETTNTNGNTRDEEEGEGSTRDLQSS